MRSGRIADVFETYEDLEQAVREGRVIVDYILYPGQTAHHVERTTMREAPLLFQTVLEPGLTITTHADLERVIGVKDLTTIQKDYSLGA